MKVIQELLKIISKPSIVILFLTYYPFAAEADRIELNRKYDSTSIDVIAVSKDFVFSANSIPELQKRVHFIMDYLKASSNYKFKKAGSFTVNKTTHFPYLMYEDSIAASFYGYRKYITYLFMPDSHLVYCIVNDGITFKCHSFFCVTIDVRSNTGYLEFFYDKEKKKFYVIRDGRQKCKCSDKAKAKE